MKVKAFYDIRKCRKDINIIKSAITSDSSNYMGAGAPAKTKKCMPIRHIFFSGKSPTFSASCKVCEHPIKTDKILEKELLVMGLIKGKVIFYVNIFRRGESVYGRWKEKIPL